MERLSILIDKRHLDLKGGRMQYRKGSRIPCEHCGGILSTKQSLKCHMVIIHSEKVTSYQCSKCPTTCNRLDNIRRHVRNKHSGQTSTLKTVMYEIQEMSPELMMSKRPRPMPRKTPLPMRQSFNEPMSTSDYIY